MTTLENDLIRWESGELTLEDVESMHPDVGIRELVRVHTRLAMLRAIPMPDVDRAWTMTVSKLEPRSEPALQRMRGWVRKPLIASFASVVMTGGAAYAAGVGPVERAVDRAWEGVKNVVTRDSHDARDVASENDESQETEVTETEVEAPTVAETPPPGDDADGERGKSKSKGASEDHRKDEANKHRGWVHKKDKKEKSAKPETPADGAEPPGQSKESNEQSPSSNAGGPGGDKSSAHTEAADDSGAEAAPVEEEPPAPPAPPAHSNAGGNGKSKDK